VSKGAWEGPSWGVIKVQPKDGVRKKKKKLRINKLPKILPKNAKREEKERGERNNNQGQPNSQMAWEKKGAERKSRQKGHRFITRIYTITSTQEKVMKNKTNPPEKDWKQYRPMSGWKEKTGISMVTKPSAGGGCNPEGEGNSMDSTEKKMKANRTSPEEVEIARTAKCHQKGSGGV